VTDYSTLLRDHVTLTCRSIDRILVQAYVPKLQTVGWVCSFLRWQRGFQIPSSAAFGEDRRGLRGRGASVRRRARHPGGPLRQGRVQGEIARPFLEKAAAEGGGGRVALIGIGQEKAPVWRSWKAKGQEHAAHPHMEWGRQMAFVNHFYPRIYRNHGLRGPLWTRPPGMGSARHRQEPGLGASSARSLPPGRIAPRHTQKILNAGVCLTLGVALLDRPVGVSSPQLTSPTDIERCEAKQSKDVGLADIRVRAGRVNQSRARRTIKNAGPPAATTTTQVVTSSLVTAMTEKLHPTRSRTRCGGRPRSGSAPGRGRRPR
jgi:hypothetical protein